MRIFLLILGVILGLVSCKAQSEETTLHTDTDADTQQTTLNTLDKEIIKNEHIVGQLDRYEDFPSENITPRTVDVWLPKNYSSNKKYAVLYMHDGKDLFDASSTPKKPEMEVDEIASRLMSQDSIKEVIVVGIYNIPKLRSDDYVPKKPIEAIPVKVKDSLLRIVKAFNPQFTFNSDNYLKFIVEELKPYIDATYSTATLKEDTYVGGVSMGGLISMYAVCEYPEIFGGAICMSTHWPGIIPSPENPIPPAFFDYMRKNVPSPKDHKFYFDFGTKGFDSFYGQFEDDVNEIFEEAGYTEENFKNLKFEGGNHNIESWNPRFHIPLVMMLEK
jgi:hypothetical protein